MSAYDVTGSQEIRKSKVGDDPCSHRKSRARQLTKGMLQRLVHPSACYFKKLNVLSIEYLSSVLPPVALCIWQQLLV